MKIICVGWNYPLHNKEMDNTLVGKEPTIFFKPESALLKDGKPFFIPGFTKQLEYETEVVIRICKLGKNISERFAPRYYDSVTLGIDFTARDIQAQARANGEPWDIAKGFDGSAVIGDSLTLDEVGGDVQNLDFKLQINGQTVQQSNTSEMIHSVNKIISYVSQFLTLKIGDLIYTGTPQGVGPVNIEDHLEGYIGEKKVLDFYVK